MDQKGKKYEHKCWKIRRMIILSRELDLILIFNLKYFQKNKKIKNKKILFCKINPPHLQSKRKKNITQ